MKKLSIFLTSILFISMQINAQWTQLDHEKIDGCEIIQYAKTTGGIYALTTGGLYKSGDNGENWNYCSGNLDTISNAPWCMTMANNKIYIEKKDSRDYLEYDNTTWHRYTPLGIPETSCVYGFGGANNKIYRFYTSNDSTYLYYTETDNQWKKGVFVGMTGCYGDVSLPPLSNTMLFIYNDGNLFMTSDGLSKMKLPFPDQDFEYIEQWSLRGEPNGDYIYYQTDNALYRLNFKAKSLSWENITSNLKILPKSFIGGFASCDNVIFATIVDSAGVKFMRSVNHGLVFDTITVATCGLSIPVINSAFQISNNYLVANCMDKWMYKTGNNGNTWAVKNISINALPADRFTEGPSGYFYNMVSEGRGIERSKDYGTTWELFNKGLPFYKNVYFPFDLRYFDGNLYLALADVSKGDDQIPLLYKLNTSLDKWELTEQPIADPLDLTIDGTNTNTLFIHTQKQNSEHLLWRSTDNCTSFEDITAPINNTGMKEVFGLKGKGQADSLFCFVKDVNNVDHVLLSVNNGDSWTVFFTVGNYEHIKRLYDSDGPALIEFGGAGNVPMIVVRGWTKWGGNDNLYIIRHKAFVKINAKGLPKILQVNSIKYSGNKWLLGTTAGVYYSTDAVQWYPVNNTDYPIGQQIQQLYCINYTLYAGTNNGIWKNPYFLGIDETRPDASFRIYPNPVPGILHVDLKAISGEKILKIYSSDGRCVYNEKASGSNVTIDASSLSRGIYMLRIENNSSIITRKFIR